MKDYKNFKKKYGTLIRGVCETARKERIRSSLYHEDKAVYPYPQSNDKDKLIEYNHVVKV
jgi:hypothetical protein